jgi:hypothetical protein
MNIIKSLRFLVAARPAKQAVAMPVRDPEEKVSNGA